VANSEVLHSCSNCPGGWGDTDNGHRHMSLSQENHPDDVTVRLGGWRRTPKEAPWSRVRKDETEHAADVEGSSFPETQKGSTTGWCFVFSLTPFLPSLLL
jgi:hypothetical protein